MTLVSEHKITTRMSKFGVDFPFFSAPMVGLTHAPFRDLVRSFTPPSLTPLLFSEMISTLRVPSERLDHSDELKMTTQDAHSVVIQILGSEKWYIAKTIQKLLALNPWGFDINMGCAVRTTLHKEWGSRLMHNAALAQEVVKMVKEETHLPVSVKTRCGVNKTDVSFLAPFLLGLEQAGADWVSVHARFAEQKHRGDAFFPLLAAARAASSLPLVGNGDIQTAEDAIKVVKEWGLDGAMIGRSVTARPWIFWQIANKLGLNEAPQGFEGCAPPSVGPEEGLFYLKGCLRLIDLIEQHLACTQKRLKKFKFYVLYSHRWYLFGHDFYSRCMRCTTLEETKEMIQKLLIGNSFPSMDKVFL
jgi:tRNA-dihydrouridine synthase